MARSEDLPTLDAVPSELPPGGCIIRKMVGRYGPYLYHVKRVGKRQTWTYLGRADGHASSGREATEHQRRGATLHAPATQEEATAK